MGKDGTWYAVVSLIKN